ncbi:MAG: hypothetical protein JWR26_586 [Pedosphaera sp.]|nr:hypothetical protein [Pedosphaera sp.]
MANKEEAKRKLEALANRVKGSSTSSLEDARLRQAVEADKIKNRNDVQKVLEESLQKNASDVRTTLASDDTQRLVDEIVQALDK